MTAKDSNDSIIMSHCCFFMVLKHHWFIALQHYNIKGAVNVFHVTETGRSGRGQWDDVIPGLRR